MHQWNGRPDGRYVVTMLMLLTVSLVAGCATTPRVEVARSPEATFDRYETFTFHQPLGTDRQDGPSTILSQTLRQATRTELESLGYRYVPADADLSVNFFVETREIIEGVRRSPGIGIGYGIFHRHYGVWADYETDIRQYTEGTLHLDVVDTETNKLAWEGVARARRQPDDLSVDRERVYDAVARMFAAFPPAGTPALP